MPIGFSFNPTQDIDMQGGTNGNGRGPSRLSPQQAVRILSLRVPESLPQNAPVARSLLTAPGSRAPGAGGLQSMVAQLMQAFQPQSGPSPVQMPPPSAPGAPLQPAMPPTGPAPSFLPTPAALAKSPGTGGPTRVQWNAQEGPADEVPSAPGATPEPTPAAPGPPPLNLGGDLIDVLPPARNASPGAPPPAAPPAPPRIDDGPIWRGPADIVPVPPEPTQEAAPPLDLGLPPWMLKKIGGFGGGLY